MVALAFRVKKELDLSCMRKGRISLIPLAPQSFVPWRLVHCDRGKRPTVARQVMPVLVTTMLIIEWRPDWRWEEAANYSWRSWPWFFTVVSSLIYGCCIWHCRTKLKTGTIEKSFIDHKGLQEWVWQSWENGEHVSPSPINKRRLRKESFPM